VSRPPREAAVAKVAAADLQIVCAWCKEVLHQGHPTSPDQVSHGCCCPCKAKYFPNLSGKAGPACEFELVEREHEQDDQPIAHNPFTDHITYQTNSYHIDHERCTHCGMERILEPEACDCEPDGDEDRE